MTYSEQARVFGRSATDIRRCRPTATTHVIVNWVRHFSTVHARQTFNNSELKTTEIACHENDSCVIALFHDKLFKLFFIFLNYKTGNNETC